MASSLSPHLSPDTRARIALSTVVTPGDRVVGQAVHALGASEALGALWSTRTTLGLTRLADRMETDPHEILALRRRYRSAPNPDQTAVVISRVVQQGLSVLTPESEWWPGGFVDLGPFAPLACFVRGHAGVLRSSSGVAVVGSRQPTPEALARAKEVAAWVVRGGRHVVSGGARGIDCAAHWTAAQSGHPQVVILASALDQLGSWQGSLVAAVEAAGVVLSETPPGRPIGPESFLHRNRLIAALSEAVVVVEAAERSGSLNTASHARSLGRDLLVCVTRDRDPKNAGCFRLLDEWGASVLTTGPGQRGEDFPPLSGASAQG